MWNEVDQEKVRDGFYLLEDSIYFCLHIDGYKFITGCLADRGKSAIFLFKTLIFVFWGRSNVGH